MKLQLVCVIVLMGLPALRAQSVFVAQDDGVARPVRAVRYGRPNVEDGGKLVESGATRFALQKAAIYSSALLTVDNVSVRIRHLEDLKAGAGVSYSMRFDARVTSDTNLENCFMVLELEYRQGTGLIYQELPNLRAGEIVPLGFVFGLTERVDEAHLKLHFFANGLELLTSRMKPAYIAAQKRKIEEFMRRTPAGRDAAATNAVVPGQPDESTK